MKITVTQGVSEIATLLPKEVKYSFMRMNQFSKGLVAFRIKSERLEVSN
jgi:hypothetical protein